MNRYRLLVIGIAGMAFLLGAVLASYTLTSPDSEGTLHVHVAGCVPNESLGFGLGAHENLGVQCENGNSYRIVVE